MIQRFVRPIVALLALTSQFVYGQTYSFDPPNPDVHQPFTITVIYAGDEVSTKGYVLANSDGARPVLNVYFVQDGGDVYGPDPSGMTSSLMVPGLDPGDWEVKIIFIPDIPIPPPVQTFNLLVGSSTVPAPFEITSGITGNWFDPQESGHGFGIEVLPSGSMLVQWYVFGPQGDQEWIEGTGIVAGNTVQISAYRAMGGLFPPYFNPDDITAEPWGTITLTFTDCNNGTASWQPTAEGYTAGSIPIERLTIPAGLACP